MVIWWLFRYHCGMLFQPSTEDIKQSRTRRSLHAMWVLMSLLMQIALKQRVIRRSSHVTLSTNFYLPGDHCYHDYGCLLIRYYCNCQPSAHDDRKYTNNSCAASDIPLPFPVQKPFLAFSLKSSSCHRAYKYFIISAGRPCEICRQIFYLALRTRGSFIFIFQLHVWWTDKSRATFEFTS